MKILNYSEPWHILEYSADYKQVELVHNVASKIILWIYRFAPIVVVASDRVGKKSDIRHKVAMIRLWNRLIGMDDNRITKNIYLTWA